MNRKKMLIGAFCATVTADAVSHAPRLPSNVAAASSSRMLQNCWQMTVDSAVKNRDEKTALFVLGACASAIAEIAKLNLPMSTIAYFDDSLCCPEVRRYSAEYWDVDYERIAHIDNPMEFAKRTIDANDRIILLGNFSAPFASQMLVSMATMARHTNRPVVAVGGTPAPGAQGEIRTQRGWTCIEELRRIGCSVTTVPEVDFCSDQFEQVDSVAASKLLGVDEGSPYCRALELALNQVDFTVASIDDDVLASKFSAGNFVSLGWGYAANGDDAAVAANMALVNGYGLSKHDNPNVSAHILVTSSGDEILAHLRTSTEIISDAIGKSAPVYFGASRNARVANKALQVTVFR